MATNKNGLIGTDPTASPQNPNGTRTNASAAAANPYQGNIATDFSGYGLPQRTDTSMWGALQWTEAGLAAQNKRMSDISSGDPDAIQAAYNSWKLQNPTSGDDGAAEGALLNMYEGRIGEKNSLASQIAGSDSQLTQQQDLNRAAAGSAVGTGLQQTRQNYNDRGLLYSGSRQGAEAAVRASGASQLASTMAGTARDAANSKTAAQNAYASVDLASQQDTLTRATQAYDTANANNIARLQAFQQLGSGLGSAAGTIAGSTSTTATPGSGVDPAANWNPNMLNADGSDSFQYAGAAPGSYGLIGGNQNQAATGQ